MREVLGKYGPLAVAAIRFTSFSLSLSLSLSLSRQLSAYSQCLMIPDELSLQQPGETGKRHIQLRMYVIRAATSCNQVFIKWLTCGSPRFVSFGWTLRLHDVWRDDPRKVHPFKGARERSSKVYSTRRSLTKQASERFNLDPIFIGWPVNLTLQFVACRDHFPL